MIRAEWNEVPGRRHLQPGSLCRLGGRSVRPTAYGSKLVDGVTATLWKPRTIVSHPNKTV